MVRSDVMEPIVIGGATASGKSALALALAQRVGGEIVCADSRQVYRGLRIASAAPSEADMGRVPHHGFLAWEPDDEMTAARFVSFADAAVAGIGARGRVPILVGGTGLYLRAWRLGLDGTTASDPARREALTRELERDGLPALVQRLQRQDPDGAARVDLRNPTRVLRALEVAEAGGSSGAHDVRALLARPPRVGAHWLWLDAPLEELEPRIRARAQAMFEGGLVQEARALEERLAAGHPLLETLGTAQALGLLHGGLAPDAAVELTTLRTRQYARRQRTWFKKEPWWRRLDATSATLVEDAVDALSFPAPSG